MGAEIKRHFANLYISDADRRCREMTEDGELESEIRNGKVYYRIRQSDIVRRFEEAKKARTIKDINNDFNEWSKQYTGNLFDF
jgi:hypothetical protein